MNSDVTVTGPNANLDAIRDDAELVERAKRGDETAKSEIVQRHMRNVYNLGLRLTGSEEGAEEVLQEAFLKVFEKLDSFRADSQLGTWIHRIATNAALMRMRSRKNKYFVPIDEQPGNDEDEQTEFGMILESLDRDPLELTLDDEVRKKLEKAILTLPENLRTAFVLKDLEGMSMAEIAEEVGKTVSAIKADLHRARLRLRRQLAEFMVGGKHG